VGVMDGHRAPTGVTRGTRTFVRHSQHVRHIR
jgi:hypothetical protein